jgi:glycerol kinase
VDGGASANDLLMQMQSDFSGIVVQRSANAEATAAGAACLAGLAVGFFASREALQSKLADGVRFSPQMEEEERQKRLDGWHSAVKACRAFRP